MTAPLSSNEKKNICEIFSKIEAFLWNKNFMISKKNQRDFTKGKKRQKKVDCRLMIHEIKMLFFRKDPLWHYQKSVQKCIRKTKVDLHLSNNSGKKILCTKFDYFLSHFCIVKLSIGTILSPRIVDLQNWQNKINNSTTYMQSLKKSFLCNKVETKAISVLKPHVYFDVITIFF